tara:strand:- start:564 stop:893 length:330 start_codon:yes stop_codon:yes gene_type:complete
MLQEIDIGHISSGPILVDRAVEILAVAISQAKVGGVVAVKIIHGSGSGALKKAVRGWLKNEKGRFKAVIYGENYSMFDKTSVAMRSQISNKNKDNDFERKNPGITIVWL